MRLGSGFRRVVQPLLSGPLGKINRLEAQLLRREGAVGYTDESPARFEIPREILNLDSDRVRMPGFPKTLPLLVSTMRDAVAALRTLDENEGREGTRIDAGTIRELEEYAASLGVGSIGYTAVPGRYVFRDKAVSFGKAIVITMEMDRDIMETAPSRAVGAMVHRTYNRLGKMAIGIAGFLRARGFAAQAGHPLMGQALYPALGELAGMGYHGLHGLLMTPEHGPRIRVAAVYTGIENLPSAAARNEHAWIGDFCLQCRACVRACPGGAVYERPRESGTGLIKCIDTEKCFQVFAEQHGCSVCVKVCPLNRVGYDRVHEAYTRGIAR